MNDLAATINGLIQDIVAYLKFLNQQYIVSVHGIDSFLGPYLSHFLPFNAHSQALCLYVKGQENLKRCIRCQQYAIASAQRRGDYFGTCYFGMSEYVFSVPLGGGRNAIVSVSGYRGPEKDARFLIAHAARKTGLDEATLLSYYKSTSQDIPSPAQLRCLVRPLVHMISYLAQCMERLSLEPGCGSTDRNAFFINALRYLEYNYRSNLSMQTLAKANHCSVSYLSHMFKSKTGLSLRAYINALRIRDAAVYLVGTDLPIGEIAYVLGFEDSNYFSTVFTREKGCSPTAYRKRYGEPE